MYPIIIPYNSAPMTDEGAQVMVGIFIFLTLIWIVVTLIRLVQIKWDIKNIFDYGCSSYDTAQMILNGVVFSFWAAIVLVFVGLFIASLIF